MDSLEQDARRPLHGRAGTPAGRGGLFLDREGRWFHEGVEITHERTRRLFSRSLFRGEDGGYVLRVGRECAPVTVQDTPFVIRSVTAGEREGAGCCTYELLLSDGSREPLDPHTLTVEREHILYARVKGGTERARFLRAAYYQLCAHIEYDELEDRYLLPWDGKPVPIRRIASSSNPGS